MQFENGIYKVQKRHLRGLITTDKHFIFAV